MFTNKCCLSQAAQRGKACLLPLLFIVCQLGTQNGYSAHKSKSVKPEENKEKYVDVELMGQFGNQLFQIATAYAYSLDHEIPLVIPELAYKTQFNAKYNAERLFLHKIAHQALPAPAMTWTEPSYHYSPIPASDQIRLKGYFQCDKYFKHRRAELLEFFAPPPELQEQILKEHPYLTSDALFVAVQIRDYRAEYPDGAHHPTFGRSFYQEAVRHFPKDAIFVVTSNNMPFAKHCMNGLSDFLIFLDSGDYIKDFYTICLCKSFIISNSSFGWWASWLSQSENKKIIIPHLWFGPPYPDLMWQDMIPEAAIAIDVPPLVRRF